MHKGTEKIQRGDTHTPHVPPLAFSSLSHRVLIVYDAPQPSIQHIQLQMFDRLTSSRTCLYSNNGVSMEPWSCDGTDIVEQVPLFREILAHDHGHRSVMEIVARLLPEVYLPGEVCKHINTRKPTPVGSNIDSRTFEYHVMN